MLYRLLTAAFLLFANSAIAQNIADPFNGNGGLFEGTIGTAKILVSLDGQANHYSYAKAPADIGLLLTKSGKGFTFTETLFVDATPEDLAGERKDTITGSWQISLNDEGGNGTWTSAKNGKTAPITLKRLGGSSTMEEDIPGPSNYEAYWLKNVDLNVPATSLKSQKFGSMHIGWVKDSVFGAPYPTLLAYPDETKMAKINVFLEEKHRDAVLGVRECQSGLGFMADAATLNAGKPKDPEYQYELTYASPTVLSMVESGSVFCGGAHPANYSQPIMFNLDTLSNISSNACAEEGNCTEMNKSGLGTLIELTTADQRERFNTMWWDRWNTAAKAVEAKGGDDGDLASECMNGFENEKPMAERNASFSLTPKGMAVTRTDFSSAAAVCNFQEGYNPIVISWADLKPFLKDGQTILVDEIK